MSQEQLWAPWRLSYIVSTKDQTAPREKPAEGCFICRYNAESADAANFVVQRGAVSIAILNRFPYNNGHLLVAPMAHKADLTDLNDEELLDCMRTLQQMTRIYKEVLNPDGFNVGLNLGRAAGAGLPGHLHWHLVPRWNGDTNFMPVFANVNVIPQSLEALHGLLRERLAAL